VSQIRINKKFNKRKPTSQMKTSSSSRAGLRLRQIALAFVLGIFAAPAARAGLTMELDLVLLDNTYSFFPNLGTNTAAPAVPFGNYFVTSPGWPTNGASALYHCDATGFNQVGGGNTGFAVFDAPDFNSSFIQNITNGQWSIFVTNSAVTNVYHYTVTASIVSNSIPPVVVIYPPNNALNVTNQPTFLWQGGPTNYSDLVLYQGPNNTSVPVTQTSYSGFTAASGPEGFTAHYDLFSTTAVVSSVPTNSASSSLSSWVSTAHLQDVATSQFTVGNPVANFNADLNTTNLPWATMGDAAWFTETTNTYNGAPAAAQSGSVTGSQSSTLSVIVTGPGTLTFYWSSIANDPHGGFSCEFDVDGNYSNNITGDTIWYQDGPYAIGPGLHILSWTAYANGDTDPTQAGFLDQVSYVTASAPTLTVTDTPPSGLAPLAVQFTSPGVDSLGNTVTNWNWNFGDGGNSTAQNPLHTYTNAGSFFPSLTAYSTHGSSPLVVTGPGTITVTNLMLNVTATPPSGVAPLVVQFASPGVDSAGNTVTNWNWTFGDGGNSRAQNPSHVYTNIGSFSPSLTAYSTHGTSPLAVTGLGVINVYSNSFPAFHTLYTFSTNFGTGPNAGLVLSGNQLYGTTTHGGNNGNGTVFVVNTDGTSFTNLYNFALASGGDPGAGLILLGGTLYGTTYIGGSQSGGTVFAINTNGIGYTNIYSFTLLVPSTGTEPAAALVSAGNTLYGTSQYGGSVDHGAVFGVPTNGATITDLHSFSTPSGNPLVNTDGDNPLSRLLLSGGNLYGTAEGGGNFGSGTVFAVSTNSPFNFNALHYFTATDITTGTNTDGAFPFAGLVLSGSMLYGTAYAGGTSGNGTVFAVNTNGLGFTNLFSFPGGNGGSGPHGGLTLWGNTLYGTTSTGGTSNNGTLFAINIDGSGFTNLYSFTGCGDGANPQADLVLSGNTLYGTTAAGGSSGNGTVFSFTLPRPLLAIARSGTNVILTWSASASGYNLEFTTNLVSPTVWNTNSTAPVILSGLNTVTNPISASREFYRLSQ
jgi:uncharacterized repeat protein (TIGR03803 family)